MHTHQVDPDGDIILFTSATSESPSVDAIEGNVPREHTRFQVSSKHLSLASDYFKRMLKACWAEGAALSTKGSAEIPVNDCKPEILLIILNIIHGRSRQVPRKLSLPQLTDIAVATDFFQCHEALEVFAGIWIQDLKPLILSSFSEDTKKWIMIAWVFKSNDILRQTETIAMQKGTGPFQTSNLPIPKSITDKIDQARQKYIQLLQQKIGERIETLLNSPAAKRKSCCNPECDAKYLGLVLRKLTENKISYSASLHGKYLVSGGSDREARVWDLETGECNYVLAGRAKAVWFVCMNEQAIVTAGADDIHFSGSEIRIWLTNSEEFCGRLSVLEPQA
ncbi:hypothetical protein N7489_002941 [Penicillium chrysogenum]|uniref:uncharacterized protein n=1 Tax=Penicillium chrysogenum TaxID=5076 RepID=UPI0024DF2682|nr:uncharacterized protein N7489_002941 [Penicillium chrysogenum]KAJ5252531.1 hypothetical protein N7489_002941 [Penicillium chrysogenum]